MKDFVAKYSKAIGSTIGAAAGVLIAWGLKSHDVEAWVQAIVAVIGALTGTVVSPANSE